MNLEEQYKMPEISECEDCGNRTVKMNNPLFCRSCGGKLIVLYKTK